MTYKRHWDYTQDGLTKIYEFSNSACHAMEVDGLKLSAGGSYQGNTGCMEYGFTILGGS